MQEKQISTTKNRRREVGQSLVELALSGLLLSVLLSGMLDFGRMYFTYIALEDSVGEAALFLSLFPDCPVPNYPTAGDCPDPNNAVWRAQNAVGNSSNNSSLEWTNAQISPVDYQFYQTVGVGETVKMQIKYNYEVVTPMMQAVLNLVNGNTKLQLVVEAEQVVVSEG